MDVLSDLIKNHSVPCEGGFFPITDEKEEELLEQIKNVVLYLKEIHKIMRKFEFEDFIEAMKIVNQVAELVEKEGYHSNFYIKYNVIELELYTHAIKGLFENDFKLAAKIYEIDNFMISKLIQ